MIRPERSLTPSESAVLSSVLSLEFAEVAVLRDQARAAVVAGRCGCGCPSVYLKVPSKIPASSWSGLLPCEGRVVPEAEELPGEIILFAEKGRLSYLEYVYYTVDPPQAWPDPSRVELLVLPR